MAEIPITKIPEIRHIPSQETDPGVPETSVEHSPVIDTVPEAVPTTTAPIAPAISELPAAPAMSLLRQQVESVLTDGLESTYAALDPEHQRQFKQVGEETASSIERLLQDSKVQVRKILHLIVRWLKIIPGVNQFFLEQEAKIKADKIWSLRHPGV